MSKLTIASIFIFAVMVCLFVMQVKQTPRAEACSTPNCGVGANQGYFTGSSVVNSSIGVGAPFATCTAGAGTGVLEPFGSPPPNPHNCDPYTGYFQLADYTNVDRVNGAYGQGFIQTVQQNLFADFTACAGQPEARQGAYYLGNYAIWGACHQNKLKAVHSAFLIETMLGREGRDPAFGNSNLTAVNLARSDFARWANIINYLGSVGNIAFANVALPCEPVWQGGRYGYDVGYIGSNCSGVLDPSIILTDPLTNDTYTIVKSCANVHGTPITIHIPGPDIDLKVNNSDSPGIIELNQPINVGWQPAPGSAPITSCTASGNTGSWSGGKQPSGSEPHNGDSTSPGQKTYQIDCSGPGGTTTDTVTLIVANKPYLRVYGSDVVAGSGFTTGVNTCSTSDSTAGIIAYNRGQTANGNPTNYGGAGVQFAAQAMAVISEFSSASLRSGQANAGPPKGLSFANTAGTGTYGGSFASAPCVPDYYSAATRVGTNVGNNINGLNVAAGQHLVYFSNGDVMIKGPITFNPAGWSATNLPSFYLVVKGNIYIDKNVTTLDGFYIALPSDPNNPGTSGRIYTCSDGSHPVNINPAYFDACDTPLTINGAFIANRVVFGRTNGSLSGSITNEGRGSTNIAEKFIYSPELWMAPGIPDGTSSGYQFNSLRSLPPVL